MWRSLRSVLGADGVLRLSIFERSPAEPTDDDVVVRMEAAPINPSDLGQMFGLADMADLRQERIDGRPALSLPLPASAMKAMRLRIGTEVLPGLEGAGTVVATGPAPAARELLGRTVAVFGAGSYSDHRIASAAMCLPLAPGTSAESGASAFVNPLTALGFVETACTAGHAAIVHTAAASNLGRMLVRLCRAEGIQLVNVVRSPAQVDLLRSEGAEMSSTRRPPISTIASSTSSSRRERRSASTPSAADGWRAGCSKPWSAR